MRIVNIVDDASPINYGVWHAAIINAGLLQDRGIRTELWYSFPENFPPVQDVNNVFIESESFGTLKKLVAERKLDPLHDVICTHGCWRFPTRWGAYLKKQGFRWMYVPQGMLEYWPLQQKKIKKLLYFNLLEKHLVKKADIIRAVSASEKTTLEATFKLNRIELLPNAVLAGNGVPQFDHQVRQYLFLSRLHPKKNVLSLANAWVNSSLNNRKDVKLVIVGPDQGDLAALQTFVTNSSNIEYLNSVYGKDKDVIVFASTFFVLPSFSEGLPSSLLEAMASGLIPVITEGCNLPEVFSLGLGVKITTEIESIKEALENTSEWSDSRIVDTSSKCSKFILENYSVETITDKQVSVINSLKKNYEQFT